MALIALPLTPDACLLRAMVASGGAGRGGGGEGLEENNLNSVARNWGEGRRSLSNTRTHTNSQSVPAVVVVG